MNAVHNLKYDKFLQNMINKNVTSVTWNNPY